MSILNPMVPAQPKSPPPTSLFPHAADINQSTPFIKRVMALLHDQGTLSVSKSSKFRLNKKFYTPIVILALLALVIGSVTLFGSNAARSHRGEVLARTTHHPSPSNDNLLEHTFQLRDGEDDEDPECVHILSQDDPCDFVRTNKNCDVDGLIPWLELRYCHLPKKITNPTVATLASSVIMSIALVIVLASLGDTADTFFISALQLVATEMKLSAGVAGISFVAIGNASPDISSSIASVRAGDLSLVLGALAGACVCISFLVLGSALVSAPTGQTTLPKFQFGRNALGYAITIGAFIAISARGTLRVWTALFLIGIYCVYLFCNVVYLQRQESKLRKMRHNDRKLKFLQQFKPVHNFDEHSQSLLADTSISSDNLSNASFSHSTDINALTLNNSAAGYVPPVVSARETHLYPSKQAQATEESQFIDRDVIDAVDIADKHDKHRLHSMALHHQEHGTVLTIAEHDTETSITAEEDEDDEVDIDESTYMSGITWPNPEWADEKSTIKLGLLKIIWVITSPFGLMKWLSIPSTQIRPDYLVGIKKFLFFLSPFFLSVFLLFTNTDGFQYEADDKLLWILLPSIGAGIALALGCFYAFIVVPQVEVYNQKRDELRQAESKALSSALSTLTPQELAHLTHMHLEYDLDLDDCDAKPGVMTFYQILISLLAFVGSISWLAFFADEVVNMLGSLGLMFGVSSTILGLTVLSLGNSLPDLISGVSLAAKGKISVSYAAIFGAPVLSSTLGFGISILLKLLERGSTTKVLEFTVSPQLWLCFGATIFGLLAHCIIYPLTKFTPPKWYGWTLIVGYLIFLVAAVLFEVLG